jgi:hypothetical protein
VEKMGLVYQEQEKNGKTTELWMSKLKRGCSFQLIPRLSAGQFSIFILFFGWWKLTKEK